MATTPAVRDAHPWRAAFVLAALTIGGTMAWSCVVAPGLYHRDRWVISDDAWYPMAPAHYIVNGAFPALYEATPEFVYPPGLPVVLAPIAAIGDRLRLSESIPAIIVPRPSMWLVLGPYGAAMSLLPLVAVRRLLTTAGVHNHRTTIQAALAVATLVPIVVIWGHFEEVLALGLELESLILIKRRNPLGASWALAGAILAKQTALLAAPILLFQIPPGPLRRRAIAIALGIPVAIVGLCLAVDWPHASAALLHAHSAPRYGHRALWVSATTRDLVSSPTRVAAVVFAAVVGYAIRRRHELSAVLAGLALTAIVRLVAEPVLFAYYLGAPLVLATLAVTAARRPWWLTWALGCIATLLFLSRPDPLLWWCGFGTVLIALAAWPARTVLAVVRRDQPPIPGERAGQWLSSTASSADPES